MDKHSRIFVAGHAGMVGSAMVRCLRSKGHDNLVTRERNDLDLTRQDQVEQFFSNERIECVVLAAARVGGIEANRTYPAEFIYENLAISTNVIHAALKNRVRKLLFLGSSCIYPRECKQPLKEDYLLTGPLEPTNEAYAVAKIAGLKMCEFYNRQYGVAFISAMPTNLYGPNDNFDPVNSHVIAGMMRRFHEAKLSGSPEVVVWGDGSPRREFLHVDDLAAGLYCLLLNYDEPATVNIGTGEDCSIAELADMMRDVTGYGGKIVFDATKPDGTPRKLLDVEKIKSMGWSPVIQLRDGLRLAYEWALSNSVLSMSVELSKPNKPVIPDQRERR